MGRRKMSGEDEYAINTTESGASLTQAIEAGQIRKGGHIMIKGKACKVKDVSVSKTGKHGHAKCKFAATCIFTGTSAEELCPSTHTIDVPFVTKKDYQVQGVDEEGFVILMDEEGEMREDLQVPDVTYKTEEDVRISKQIKEFFEEIDNGATYDVYCTVMSAIGKEKITEVRKKDS